MPILRGARRVTGRASGRKTGLNSVTAGAEQNKRQDWTFQGFAPEFDAHVREQLPWYGMATESVALIARHYIPRRGLVYDLGASTGNVGRVLSPTLAERNARLVALDEVPDMVKAYNGPGRAVMADVARYPYKPFHVPARPGAAAVACDAAGEGEAGRGYHRRGQGRIARRLSGYGAVPADVGLQAEAGRGAGGGDAERAFAVRRAAAFVQGRVGG